MIRKGLGAFMAVALLAARAYAQAPPTDAARTEARERFDRGLQLFNDGDNAGALAEFKRAHELIPNRLVLFNVGLVYAAMNRPVEATETLDRVLADPGPLSADRLAVARRTRDEQARKVGRLDLTTNVPAVIEVDGVQVARTPLERPLPVASGTRLVAALAPGHLPVRREVTVPGSARVELRLELQPTERRVAHLLVRTPVPDAEVLVDGQLAGRTPMAASVAVAPGAHVVELRRAGYRTARRELTLDEGATGELELSLEEDPAPGAPSGYLTIVASEPEIHVTVDGRARGVYGSSLRLPAGAHRLRIERAGFEPVERTVDVPGGGEGRVVVTLSPTPETRLAYVTRTRARQRWGWITGAAGVLVTAAGAGGFFYTGGALDDARADLERVRAGRVRFARGECDPAEMIQHEVCDAKLASAEAKVGDLETARVVSIAATAAGVATMAVGAFLLWGGDDPARYDRPASDSPFAGLTPAGWVSAGGGGVALLGTW